MVVFDTDILIDAINGKKRALDVMDEYDARHERIALTVLNKYELLKGRQFTRKEFIDDFISEMKVYDLKNRDLDLASSIYKELEDHGSMIEEIDILIAAIALSNGEGLVTFDRHFKKINNKGVRVVES
ncbi:MAG: type II toxin-antitoxin system VapC family toxin [Candidatus Micrarchaeota archaeon]|nr:type II toxin-antitoxin system VapC family toxin [Candidatus Micrarchaeota archaeon]MDE1849343.1 type II toxin-antitoxin system VapC family toxin [Candidatus Micrarchaeota archaeon]